MKAWHVKRAASLALGVTLFSSVLRGEDGTLVRLSMAERLGVARAGEPVTSGIPLPQGAVASADELALRDANGGPMPVELRPVVRWPDGSLKWVHAYFMADAPANGSASVALARGTPTLPARPLTVRDEAETIVVDTGTLRFSVRKTGFNVLDAVWFDPSGRSQYDETQPAVTPHKFGLRVHAEGRDYWAHRDGDVKVTVEHAGPMLAVIRAEGTHRDEAGEGMLDFVVRMHAMAGSSTVRVTHTVLNRQGDRQSFVDAQAVHIELPTAFGDGAAQLDGGKPVQLTRSDAEAFVHAFDVRKTRDAAGVETTHEFEPESGLPGRLLWRDAANGHGIATGIRWFWQMYPKSVEARGDGRLVFGLVPDRHEAPVRFYCGVARTHDVALTFVGPGREGETRAAAAWAAVEQPLRAFAPPRWYCRDTKAFGLLTEADPDLYEPEYLEAVRKYDGDFEKAYDLCRQALDSYTRNRTTMDCYGILAWGDGFHWALRPNDTRPANIMWNGNYYGFPHMMAMQWARTGHEGYFGMFERHARHVADVHTVHYDPNPRWIGANRYCPPPEHVRNHRSSDPQGNQVFVSPTFNHHKAESFFHSWYLLADHRMLDAIDEVGDYIMRYRSADRSGSQPRGPGNLMMTLAQLYSFHGYDEAWLNRFRQAYEANHDQKPRFTFQLGFWLEGVRRYYETTGDERALQRMRQYGDEVMAESEHTDPNRAHAFGFLYGATGERKYRDFAAASVRRSQPGYSNRWKDFGSHLRNGMFALHWLSRDAEPFNNE